MIWRIFCNLLLVVFGSSLVFCFSSIAKSTDLENVNKYFSPGHLVPIVIISIIVVQSIIEYVKKLGWIKRKSDVQIEDIHALVSRIMPRGMEFNSTEAGGIIHTIKRIARMEEKALSFVTKLDRIDDKVNRLEELHHTPAGTTPNWWCLAKDLGLDKLTVEKLIFDLNEMKREQKEFALNQAKIAELLENIEKRRSP